MSLLHELNETYMRFHTAKEEAFWSAKMGLKNFVPGDFEANEIRLKDFSSDPEQLHRVRRELERADLTPEERQGLKGWERFFAVNTIDSEEARQVFNRLIDMEGELDRSRRSMPLGYRDPATGEHVPADSVKLSLMISTSPDEGVRQAAWEGLRAIEPYVLEHGFIEIVKERNRLARLLGYEDYYDYKVSINEGFGKATLFGLLDELERDTRAACDTFIESAVARHGDGAAEAWNLDFFMSGDLTKQTDPYFRFDMALERWGRSFAALGIDYGDATLTLDLVSRAGKYENGFMHGPYPCYVEEGHLHPARINFTANAVPGQIGSGKRAIKTLLHEGGHAAHFSNIRMPAPCFAQEFAPTSVAFAETQSMFLDSFMGDPDWLARYALNEAEESMPIELIKRTIENEHTVRAHGLRRMLVVSYVEKAIYEMSEEELTPENILRTLRELEQALLRQPAAGRPVLSIPHLLAGESSAYYHGYTLAQMAVYHTRAYFLKRDGYLMDNPAIGRDLAVHYWRPGNSLTFLEMIENLTGEPFSAKATVDLVNMPLEAAFAEAERVYAREPEIPRSTEPIKLGATIAAVHGDQVIASTADGDDFETVSAKFGEWIRSQEG